MKNLSLLVWLTQLGLSVALPLAGFILLGVWLNKSCGWGDWALWAGVLLGGISAIDGFRNSLKAMERMAKDDHKEEPPAVYFNDHD